MAHELLIGDDGKAAMFYVDEVPWHDLGQRVHGAPTAEEAIRIAQLNWEVAKAPLFYHESLENTAILPDHFAVVPSKGWIKKTRPVFGIVTDEYEPLQNHEAFAFFDPLIKQDVATYETAGALGEGERVWVLAKLKNPIEIRGDKTEKYLLLSNSHDGKSSIQIKFTPIRVVCNNTLCMALSRGSHFQIVHARDMKERLERTQRLLSVVTTEYADIEHSFNAMAKAPVDEERLTQYLVQVYPEPKQPDDKKQKPAWEKSVERIERSRACCQKIFSTRELKRDEALAQTLWGAYNTVTEFVDHCCPAKSIQFINAKARLKSMWYGKGAETKVHAYGVAMGLVEEWTN